MSDGLYSREAEVVQRAIACLRAEPDSSLVAELEAKQRAAATGLEWYGITKGVFDDFLVSRRLSDETRAALREAARAVRVIYGDAKRRRDLSPGWRWGAVLAGLYLLVAVPCAALYLLDRHEHSIPMFILSRASFPMRYLLFDVLRTLTAPIGQLPHGEALSLGLLVMHSALLYFVLGWGAGWMAARRARTRRTPRSQ